FIVGALYVVMFGCYIALMSPATEAGLTGWRQALDFWVGVPLIVAMVFGPALAVSWFIWRVFLPRRPVTLIGGVVLFAAGSLTSCGFEPHGPYPVVLPLMMGEARLGDYAWMVTSGFLSLGLLVWLSRRRPSSAPASQP